MGELNFEDTDDATTQIDANIKAFCKYLFIIPPPIYIDRGS